MTRSGWRRAFADPIPLPAGGELATLLAAGRYIAALPRGAQNTPAWQAAAEALLLVVEHEGDPMLARIAMLRALNAGRPTAPPRRRAKVYTIVRQAARCGDRG